MKKKILVFGASGTLGTNIIYYLKEKYNFVFNVHNQKIFFENIDYCKIFKNDLRNRDDLYTNLKIIKPDIVINCAANTNLDFCEKFPSKSDFINAQFPIILAKVCKDLSIKLVHISTDHLFNGIDKIKKKENFRTDTINVYAKQKLFAEKNIIKHNSNSLIIRTNFFGYSLKKNQFIDQIIDKEKKGEKVILYDDYLFTTISTKYFAIYLDKLIKKKIKGIVNVVSDQMISKYDFGIEIFNLLNLNKKLIIKKKLNQINHKAKRCKNLSLSNYKLRKIVRIKAPTLKNQLSTFFKEKKYTEKKIFSKIPYGKHSINNKDIISVSNVLKFGSLTQGSSIYDTEKKIANYVGSKFAVLVSSATAGLHITYKALNLNSSNKLLTSPITFVSTSNAALYCNSKIIFNDINLSTIGLSLEHLKKNLINHNIRIIAPVHMGGLSINAKEINDIAKKNNAYVVEDAAHALGAKYICGAKVGSCKYSDATVFSFHPVKIIASGEGGAITTNNKVLYEKLLRLRTHGITDQVSTFNNKFAYTKKEKNLWYYEMQDLGYHYRQTEIHAALLSSQLDRIENFLLKRKKLATRYDRAFSNLKYVSPIQKSFRDISSNHLYILNINFDKLKINRNDFMKKLKLCNITTQVHYMPVPIHPYYRKLGYHMKNLNVAENYYKHCISIPLYYDLSYEQQNYVIKSVLDLIN